MYGLDILKYDIPDSNIETFRLRHEVPGGPFHADF